MWTGINDIDRMFDAMDLFRSKLNRAFRIMTDLTAKIMVGRF